MKKCLHILPMNKLSGAEKMALILCKNMKDYEPVVVCGGEELKAIFEKNNINVIRVGLQSTDEISENGSVVAGPVHSSFRELVESSIYYDIICGKLKDGCKRADVYVNQREVSKAVGNKRCNIIKLKQEKNIDVKICTDENLEKREVRCTCY